MGKQTPLEASVCALLYLKMWLSGSQVILLCLEPGHTSLGSTEQAEGESLQVLFLTSALGSVLTAAEEGCSALLVAKVLRALVRQRSSEYKVLLIIMFCSSRKELLPYKSPVLVRSGLDSRFRKLKILFMYN